MPSEHTDGGAGAEDGYAHGGSLVGGQVGPGEYTRSARVADEYSRDGEAVGEYSRDGQAVGESGGDDLGGDGYSQDRQYAGGYSGGGERGRSSADGGVAHEPALKFNVPVGDEDLDATQQFDAITEDEWSGEQAADGGQVAERAEVPAGEERAAAEPTSDGLTGHGNGLSENRPTENGPAGNEPTGDGLSGNGSTGNGSARNGLARDGLGGAGSAGATSAGAGSAGATSAGAASAGGAQREAQRGLGESGQRSLAQSVGLRAVSGVMEIPGGGIAGGGPLVVPAGSVEEAMRSEVERPRPRPPESDAIRALRAWCRARTAIVPSGFTIQVQVVDPGSPSYRFDLEPPEVDDPEFAAEKLSWLLGDLWLTESAGEHGGWLFARIDAAGRTLRIDRWYDQIPEWWDTPVEPRLDVMALVRRLSRRDANWQPTYLEKLYTTVG